MRENMRMMIDENASASLAMSLLTVTTTHVVLQAVLELGILDIIKNVGPNSSVKESVAHLPSKNQDAAMMIDRMLQLLVSQSVLTCTIKEDPDGLIERRYGLAPVCKFFTKDEDGISLAPMVRICNRIIDTGCCSNELNDSILEGGHPFKRAYGMPQFVYIAQNPTVSQKFNTTMASHSTIITQKILSTYKGFEGLSSVVDVGGGNGATLKVILSKYPSIKGINFDLPHVVDVAPPCSAVEHVGGDMFESVPKGDALYLK
ncbi:Caffeic acid 3-O-methyltransferase, partial [Bienertia sinuspersici]